MTVTRHVMSRVPALTAFLAAAITPALDDWGPLPKATDPEMATRGVTVWEVTSRRASGNVRSLSM
jgi:hypothetical protein